MALEGFVPFNFEEGVPYVSVTSNGVTFNKAVVLKLKQTKHAVLLFDDERKLMAVQACDEEMPNATQFYKERASGVISVRWNAKDLLNTIQDMMGWELDKNSYRIDGVLLKAENAMLFDLTRATELK